MRDFAFLMLLLCSLLTACGSSPVVKKVLPSPSPTPIPPEATSVKTPINVSFSTYSKDWPVGWQWVDPMEKTDPTSHDVKKGVLNIQITTPKDLRPGKTSSPRYIKAMNGDLAIETRVRFLPKENYQGAGLLLFKDDNNFVRFDRAYGGFGGGGEGLRLDVISNGEQKYSITPDELPLDAAEVDLMLVKKNDTVSAFWRLDEESPWREAAQIDISLGDVVFAGVSMSNTAREIAAEFVYIKMTPVTK